MKKIKFIILFLLLSCSIFSQDKFLINPSGLLNRVYHVFDAQAGGDSINLFRVFNDTPFVDMNKYQFAGYAYSTIYLDTASGNWKGWNPKTKSYSVISGGGGQSYNFTSPLSLSGNTVSIPVSTSSVNGYLSSADWATFNNKQASLVSGTNIKTINGGSILGSGDIALQPNLISGTNIKTINSTSLLGSGNISVQPTLVSGSSIKTINSNSLLGSGDIAVQPTLVSGTSIKTINGVSVLGSGNINVSPTIDYSYATLAYSSSITVDYNTHQKYVLTLTGNTTFSYANFPDGGTVIIYAIQDGTGGRTMTFPIGTVAALGVLSGLVANSSTAPNAADKISITKNNITGKYEVEMAKDYQ